MQPSLDGSWRANKVYDDINAGRAGVPGAFNDVLLVCVFGPVYDAIAAMVLRSDKLLALQSHVIRHINYSSHFHSRCILYYAERQTLRREHAIAWNLRNDHVLAVVGEEGAQLQNEFMVVIS